MMLLLIILLVLLVVLVMFWIFNTAPPNTPPATKFSDIEKKYRKQ